MGSELQQQIQHSIHKQGGSISFSEFMRQALYTPQLGYYTSARTKLGRQGDFITAPELSPLFGKTLAQSLQSTLQQFCNPILLELGAGTGKLATDLLQQLQALDALPKEYWILEVSGDLQAQQRATLKKQCPELLDRIKWLSQLPDKPYQGIVIANEVIDAMPVERFALINGQPYELAVGREQDHFVWRPRDIQETTFLQTITALQQRYLNQIKDYHSEVLLSLPAWIQALADNLTQGLMLFIDYGFAAREYYHPDRTHGTLMCHWQQQAHPDPFIHLGEQDITAHVDFTAVAEAALKAHLEVLGYTSQAAFLLENGLLDQLPTDLDDQQRYAMTQQIRLLTEPQEMGELFKVIALGKDLAHEVPGFTSVDQRYQL